MSDKTRQELLKAAAIFEVGLFMLAAFLIVGGALSGKPAALAIFIVFSIALLCFLPYKLHKLQYFEIMHNKTAFA
ncbi:MAG: hypothetical protein HGA22_14285, partial [Clostridiales bacterium]|nr:hypothetical protein [Clostridiales bacterium]